MRNPRSFSLPENHSLMGRQSRATSSKRSPWPAEGIREGSTIEDYVWGYLCIDQNGAVSFDDSTQPTNDEILLRWGHYLRENCTR